MALKRFYVYTHAYPDETVFYVGKGQRLRYLNHLQEARRGHQCPKCEVIRSIWQSGQEVITRIVFQTNLGEEALDMEAHYIRIHEGPFLLNIRRPSRGEKPQTTPVKLVAVALSAKEAAREERRKARLEEWRRNCEQTRLAKGGFWLFGF